MTDLPIKIQTAPLPDGVAVLAPSDWQKLAFAGETLAEFCKRRPELFGIIKDIGK